MPNLLFFSLTGKFVQFSSERGGQVPPFSSVQFSSFHELFRRDAEPEPDPEPREPAYFGQSRIRRNILFGTGAGPSKKVSVLSPKEEKS